MASMYPELEGLVVSAPDLMRYVFDHHDHMDTREETAFVASVPLEKWIRQAAHRPGKET